MNDDRHTDTAETRGERVALLPCPFCGGEAEPVDGMDGLWPSHITCFCGCDLSAGSMQDAIAAWNCRAAQEPTP